MEGENLFWTRTPPKTKSNYHERGRAARKDESSLFIQGEKSASEKEIKREKNPDAGFKITEQILSICLAHLILCCIEETVMDKVNPASPSGCVLAWTELRTVTHSRETHTHTVANIFSESFQSYASFLFSSWWGFVWRNTSYQGTACQSETGRWFRSPERVRKRVCKRKVGVLVRSGGLWVYTAGVSLT